MKLTQLAVLVLATMVCAAHAEEYFGTYDRTKTGTEWAKVGGSLSSYVEAGYELKVVTMVGSYINYYLQSKAGLVRCSQQSYESGAVFFVCAQAVAPREIDKPKS